MADSKAEISRRSYYKNLTRSRELARKKTAKYNKKFPGKARERNWKAYGILNASWDNFLDILKGQDYKCPICIQPISIEACLDHNHKTGKIRGVLCGDCNHALGRLNDDVESLSRAIKYLETK